MEAYEFQTTLTETNDFIQIPTEYRKKLFGVVKVILMQDNNTRQSVYDKPYKKAVSFPYFAVDTTDFVFNREEANER
ncbi:MAG: hypothetical protein FWH17_00895 [Oscillospiraceae bacterium]|nr:hypothetical protein [Oscillospiraceae bacterium]